MPGDPYPSYQADEPRPLVSLTSTVSLTTAVHRLLPTVTSGLDASEGFGAVCCSGEIAINAIQERNQTCSTSNIDLAVKQEGEGD